jgi:hypothetical protein
MVSISDKASAIAALDKEKKALWAESQKIAHDQKVLADFAAEKMREYSNMQINVLNRMIAIEDAIEVLLK